MVIAIIVAFVVVIHVQCLVSVYLSLVKIKYTVCVWKKNKKKQKKTKKTKNKKKNIMVPVGFLLTGMTISEDNKIVIKTHSFGF